LFSLFPTCGCRKSHFFPFFLIFADFRQPQADPIFPIFSDLWQPQVGPNYDLRQFQFRRKLGYWPTCGCSKSEKMENLFLQEFGRDPLARCSSCPAPSPPRARRLNPEKLEKQRGFAKDYFQYGLWLNASGARRLRG